MWEREYKSATTQATPSPAPLATPSRPTLGAFSHNRRPIKRARLRDIDELLKEGRRIKVLRLVGDELEVYLNSELETDDNLVPLQSWLRDAVRAKYPSLSKFAIDVYSTPAMSSEAERAISTAGFTLKGSPIFPKRGHDRGATVS